MLVLGPAGLGERTDLVLGSGSTVSRGRWHLRSPEEEAHGSRTVSTFQVMRLAAPTHRACGGPKHTAHPLPEAGAPRPHLTGEKRPDLSSVPGRGRPSPCTCPIPWGGEALLAPEDFAFEIRNGSVFSLQVSFLMYRVSYVTLIFFFSFVFLHFNRLLMVSGFLSLSLGLDAEPMWVRGVMPEALPGLWASERRAGRPLWPVLCAR